MSRPAAAGAAAAPVVAAQGDRAPAATIDAAALPNYGFGHRGLTWWGTLGLIAIESTVFALAVVCYFYLQGQATHWPPHSPPPQLLWGTLNTVVLLASMLPNEMLRRAAQAGDLRRIRIGIVACLAFSAVFLVLRGFEFGALEVRWDADAYGSVVWLLLGLHTLHLVTDTWDTGVLAVLSATGPLEGQRLVDFSENAVYWYFVVASWLPIYAVIYWAPRWL